VPKPPRYYGSVGKKNREKQNQEKEIMTTNETR